MQQRLCFAVKKKFPFLVSFFFLLRPWEFVFCFFNIENRGEKNILLVQMRVRFKVHDHEIVPGGFLSLHAVCNF